MVCYWPSFSEFCLLFLVMPSISIQSWSLWFKCLAYNLLKTLKRLITLYLHGSFLLLVHNSAFLSKPWKWDNQRTRLYVLNEPSHWLVLQYCKKMRRVGMQHFLAISKSTNCSSSTRLGSGNSSTKRMVKARRVLANRIWTQSCIIVNLLIKWEIYIQWNKWNWNSGYSKNKYLADYRLLWAHCSVFSIKSYIIIVDIPGQRYTWYLCVNQFINILLHILGINPDTKQM